MVSEVLKQEQEARSLSKLFPPKPERHSVFSPAAFEKNPAIRFLTGYGSLREQPGTLL